MSDEGYKARIYAVEWHANLWRVYGGSLDLCEQMMRFCLECVEADYYDFPRPITDSPLISDMQSYFDRLFAQPSSSFPAGVDFS